MHAVTVREPVASRRQTENAPQSGVSSAYRTLSDLAALGSAEARALYESARVPRLADVHGDLRGRMLALEGTSNGWFARALRAFARWSLFPWRGKSFTPLSEDHGEGINRVFSDVKPRRWFRFETRIARSRAGDFDALHLDYDNPENPFYIRAIKDEIREVAPGLYLGQAYLVTNRKSRLVLYFGLAKQAPG
jgi:hypothetical protein